MYNLCPSNYFNGKTHLIAALPTKDSSQKCCSWRPLMVLLLTVVVIDLVFQASSKKHRVGVGFHLTPCRRSRPHKSAPRVLIVLSAHTEWLLQFLWLEDNETSVSSAWVYSFPVDFEFFLTSSQICFNYCFHIVTVLVNNEKKRDLVWNIKLTVSIVRAGCGENSET